MAEKKITVHVDPEILDLVPVLKESLQSELKALRQAVNEKDFEKARETAHSSRGAALTFGFDSYAQLLLRVREPAQQKDHATLLALCNSLEQMIESAVFKPR